MFNPRTSHYDAVIRILRYLKGVTGKRLRKLKLWTLPDSRLAGSRFLRCRLASSLSDRSTMGFLYSLEATLFHEKAKSKLLCLDLVQSQIIESWQITPLSWFGYNKLGNGFGCQVLL